MLQSLKASTVISITVRDCHLRWARLQTKLSGVLFVLFTQRCCIVRSSKRCRHCILDWLLGLTRESLFEILARSETRFLDPKFSRDFRETRESKLVARLASCESHRQKFHSENRQKRVLLRNFVAKIASYEPRRKKFCRKTSFSRVSQTNFVARLARIITNFNSGVLRESCEKF